MSKISVHIVTFNSEGDIARCLDAVLRQSHSPEQIIIIDNASTDRTCERIVPFLDQVQLVCNSENIGFAAAHNQALHLAPHDCSFHLVLNPDVILHPDYLHELMQFARRHPKAGSLTGLLLSGSNSGKVDSAGLRINRGRRAFDRGQGEPALSYSTPCEVFGVSGAAALYRRDMMEEISCEGQFFDEAFFAYKEDVDVAWRARLAGWTAYCVPSANALHERGWKQGERGQRTLKIRRHSFENRYRMMIKNDKGIGFLIGLPYILLTELAQFGYLMVKEPELFVSYIRILRDLPQLLRQRRTVQRLIKPEYGKIYSFFR